MVVAAHANYLNAVTRAPSGALRHYMWSGVNLFFVLSGYLITRPFIVALCQGRPRPRVLAYTVRRASRILPAYWLVIAVSLLIMRPLTATWSQVVIHLLLIHDSVPGQTYTVVGVAWTLGVEAAFYVLVPLAAAVIGLRSHGPVAPRRIAAIIVGAWILSAVWSWAVASFGSDWMGNMGSQGVNDAGDGAPALLTVNLPAKLFLFCPGVLIALAECCGALESLRLTRTAVGRAVMVLASGVLWWAGVLVDWGHSTPASRSARDELFAAAFGVLLVIALQTRPWRSPLARAAACVGVVSYGLYLWHGITEDWIRDAHVSLPTLGGPTSTWLLATAAVALTGLIPATLSWVLLERSIIARAARAFSVRTASSPHPPDAVTSHVRWRPR